MTHLSHAMLPGRLADCNWSVGVLAGIAGGAAEIAWIALCGRLFGVDAAVVAGGVAETVFAGLAPATPVVALGIVIHMALAIALGAAIVALLDGALPRLRGTAFEPPVVVGLLVAVWAVNFHLVLPAINPAFVDLVPDGVGLASKVLFGVAAACVMRSRRRAGPAA